MLVAATRVFMMFALEILHLERQSATTFVIRHSLLHYWMLRLPLLKGLIHDMKLQVDSRLIKDTLV